MKASVYVVADRLTIELSFCIRNLQICLRRLGQCRQIDALVVDSIFSAHDRVSDELLGVQKPR